MLLYYNAVLISWALFYQSTIQTSMDGILAGVQSIVSGTLAMAHSLLRHHGVEDIQHIFDDAEDPFKGIGTRYLQDKCI